VDSVMMNSFVLLCSALLDLSSYRWPLSSSSLLDRYEHRIRTALVVCEALSLEGRALRAGPVDRIPGCHALRAAFV
jgi:hypothetical protein